MMTLENNKGKGEFNRELSSGRVRGGRVHKVRDVGCSGISGGRKVEMKGSLFRVSWDYVNQGG